MRYFTVGDVEQVENGFFIRLWFDNKQKEELNKKFNAQFSNTEWITMVANEQLNQVNKIVAYCEALNKEFDLSALFTKENINKYLEKANDWWNNYLKKWKELKNIKLER